MRLLLAAAVIALTACGDASSSSPTDDKPQIDGPVMRYPMPSESMDWMAALVHGFLELEDTCLYLTIADAPDRYPVLWPAGTTWDPTSQAVVSPAGAAMPIGSEVSGGGGYLKIYDVKRLAGLDAAALASLCLDNRTGEIVVLNNQDTAIGPAGA